MPCKHEREAKAMTVKSVLGTTFSIMAMMVITAVIILSVLV